MRIVLLLTILLLLPGLPTRAEEESGKKPDPTKTIEKLAAEKRDALILVHTHGQDDEERSQIGCFVDAEGRAVVRAVEFSNPKTPGFYRINGARLKAPELLAIDTDYQLALVKFPEKPKAWIEAREEGVPLMSEKVGLMPVVGKRTAIVGPASCYFMRILVESINMRLVTVFNLAAGPSMGNPTSFPGCPVIDQNGKLCGLMAYMPLANNWQGYPITPAEAIYKLVENGSSIQEPIPYPLKGELNPFDQGIYHPEYLKAVKLLVAGENLQKAIEHLMAAQEDMPDSRAIKVMHMEVLSTARYDSGTKLEKDDKIIALAKQLDPGPDAHRDEKIFYLGTMGEAHRMIKQPRKAIDFFEKQIALSPDNYHTPHANLSHIYSELRDMDKSIEHMQKSLAIFPTNLGFLEALSYLLGEKGRWKEADKITDQIFIYESLLTPLPSW